MVNEPDTVSPPQIGYVITNRLQTVMPHHSWYPVTVW
jgi:hypothetical protein